jgi:hypothetical protein
MIFEDYFVEACLKNPNVKTFEILEQTQPYYESDKNSVFRSIKIEINNKNLKFEYCLDMGKDIDKYFENVKKQINDFVDNNI